MRLTFPPINKPVLIARYNGYGAGYEDHARRLGYQLDQQVQEVLADRLGEQSRLLDVGSSSGLATSRLDPDRVSIVLMDIAQETLKASRQKRNRVPSLVRADFDFQLPFSDQQFDCVICISALELVGDLKFTLFEMMRVLKKGGILLFTIDLLNPESRIQRERTYIHDPSGFFLKRHTSEEVHEVLDDLNMNLEWEKRLNAYLLEEEWVEYGLYLGRK